MSDFIISVKFQTGKLNIWWGKKLKTVFCLGDGGGGLTEDRHEGNV